MSDIYINRGVNVRYAARVRLPGRRKWEAVGNDTTSYDEAFTTLSEYFAAKQWKRGELVMIADYCDPVAIVKMER